MVVPKKREAIQKLRKKIKKKIRVTTEKVTYRYISLRKK